MSPRLSFLVFAPALLAGCLQEGSSPTGQRLFPGLKLESPGFTKVGGETMVRFYERKEESTTSKGGVLDLWVTSFDGKRQHQALANRSDRWGEQGTDSAGGRYLMADERTATTASGTVPIASLVRLGPTYVEEQRIEDVATFSTFSASLTTLFDQPSSGQTCPGFPNLTNNCPQILLERPAPSGSKYPTLVLWDGEKEIPIGPDSGSFANQFAGAGTLYFLLGDDHVLTRLKRPSYQLESLRANVTRFQVSSDEHYVALSVSDAGKTQTVIRDLRTGIELSLARPNPSGWGGFDGNTFRYTQNATSTAKAEVHSLDLTTGQDQVVYLPSPLINLSSVLARPNSNEELLVDTLGHGVFIDKGDLTAKRSLDGPLVTPSFTPDGAFLIYITPATPTLYDTTIQGPLMFRDAELTNDPVMVSPAGLLVNGQNGQSYFFTSGDTGQILVFWAHLGRAASDLYFVDYVFGQVPGNLRLIAQSILSVSVSAKTLFGVLDMSQQDGTGDLVYRRIDTGKDTLYAHAVSEATELGGTDLSTSYTAYIVRGRADSDRSGLWLTTLAPSTPPDGGTD